MKSCRLHQHRVTHYRVLIYSFINRHDFALFYSPAHIGMPSKYLSSCWLPLMLLSTKLCRNIAGGMKSLAPLPRKCRLCLTNVTSDTFLIPFTIFGLRHRFGARHFRMCHITPRLATSMSTAASANALPWAFMPWREGLWRLNHAITRRKCLATLSIALSLKYLKVLPLYKLRYDIRDDTHYLFLSSRALAV